MLVGAGASTTVITAERGPAVLSDGPGLLGLRDLTVRWEGTGHADVVSARNGIVQFESCVFTSGAGSAVMAGVRLGGQAQGLVAHCAASGNEDGVVIEGGAQPMLEANVCQRNRKQGIGFAEEAAGTAR